MGPTINYTRRSVYPNHRVAKAKLDERRERQQLAQRKMEEAVQRARRSTAGAASQSANQNSSSSTASTAGKRWQFSHARREGDRKMGAAVSQRSALTTSAYGSLPPEKLEKKKHLLLAQDWTGLSRSNSPASRSRSHTIMEDNVNLTTTSSKPDSKSSARRAMPGSKVLPVPKLEPVPEIKVEVKQEEEEENTVYQNSSSVDVNMPSSPPHQDMTLSSSIQSNASSSLPSSRPDYMPTSKREAEDVKPSSAALSAIENSQTSSATYGTTSVQSDSKSEGPSAPLAEAVALHETLQFLPSPFKYAKHIREIYFNPTVVGFYLPCMWGEHGPPLKYDGVVRSGDYLGMAFAGSNFDY